jgi:uncharacterized membrane protein
MATRESLLTPNTTALDWRDITINRIGVDDLKDAVRRGLEDFRQMPTHLVILALAYPVFGFIAGRWAFGQNLTPLLFPLVSGFALVGPLAAVGLYELSRRREAGLATNWSDVRRVLDAPSLMTLIQIGVLILGLFFAWLYSAMSIMAWAYPQGEPETLGEFYRTLFTTASGLKLILVGNFVGFLFALAVLAISVVSLPMTLDKHVDAPTALAASVKAFATNPGTMAKWGLMVTAALVLGALPLLVGLAVVVPVLGHATWHLYRKLVG